MANVILVAVFFRDSKKVKVEAEDEQILSSRTDTLKADGVDEVEEKERGDDLGLVRSPTAVKDGPRRITRPEITRVQSLV